MKIIDLLNKIAKGEEVPKKIKYNNELWEYYEDLKDYIRPGKPNTLFTMYYVHEILNNEAEVLEEVEDKEYEDIEEIKICLDNDKYFIDEINALIRNQKKILERLDKE